MNSIIVSVLLVLSLLFCNEVIGELLQIPTVPDAFILNGAGLVKINKTIEIYGDFTEFYDGKGFRLIQKLIAINPEEQQLMYCGGNISWTSDGSATYITCLNGVNCDKTECSCSIQSQPYALLSAAVPAGSCSFGAKLGNNWSVNASYSGVTFVANSCFDKSNNHPIMWSWTLTNADGSSTSAFVIVSMFEDVLAPDYEFEPPSTPYCPTHKMKSSFFPSYVGNTVYWGL